MLQSPAVCFNEQGASRARSSLLAIQPPVFETWASRTPIVVVYVQILCERPVKERVIACLFSFSH